MKQYKDSRKQWNKGVRNNIISKLLMVSQSIYIIKKLPSGIVPVISNQQTSNNGPLVIVNILLAVFSAILYLSSKSAKRSAIESYNNIHIKDRSDIHFGQTSNGIGLVYNF